MPKLNICFKNEASGRPDLALRSHNLQISKKMADNRQYAALPTLGCFAVGEENKQNEGSIGIQKKKKTGTTTVT